MRTSTLPPGGTSSTWWAAHFVPDAATGAPCSTWSLIAALGCAPSDSFSQNSSGASANSRHSPSSACVATAPPSVGAIAGFAPPCHDHVFRNHSVGSTCSGAGSGPRLCTVTSIAMSSGAAFAYSTTTSK
jgi:hypothetical protein